MANKSTITKTFVLKFDEVMFKCRTTSKRPLSLIVREKKCKGHLFTGYQIFEFDLSKTNQTSCKECIFKNYCSGSNTKRKKASPKEAQNG